mmetsp:Transcript_13902/g.15977  ORF Transcript_13902/g.15977 Transcript_13902/m.15977 type:complete len:274 (-) Transcript_13902:836-1657(-)
MDPAAVIMFKICTLNNLNKKKYEAATIQQTTTLVAALVVEAMQAMEVVNSSLRRTTKKFNSNSSHACLGMDCVVVLASSSSDSRITLREERKHRCRLLPLNNWVIAIATAVAITTNPTAINHIAAIVPHPCSPAIPMKAYRKTSISRSSRKTKCLTNHRIRHKRHHHWLAVTATMELILPLSEEIRLLFPIAILIRSLHNNCSSSDTLYVPQHLLVALAVPIIQELPHPYHPTKTMVIAITTIWAVVASSMFAPSIPVAAAATTDILQEVTIP